jgi:AcrR family transcriptional regulator
MIMDKRRERKDLIIAKARETFLQKGLFNTVMDDIADRVGLTRRTLYRYFKTKEDLAYETTIVLLKEWNDYQKMIFDSLEGNGIERLESFLNNLIDYMSNKIEVMKYLGEFDFCFQDGTTIELDTNVIVRFDEIILESDRLITEIINLGQEDKSIKSDFDVKLMVATISNMLWSFGQRVAIRDKIIMKESGFPGLDLIKNQVSIYIMAIKED